MAAPCSRGLFILIIVIMRVGHTYKVSETIPGDNWQLLLEKGAGMGKVGEGRVMVVFPRHM